MAKGQIPIRHSYSIGRIIKARKELLEILSPFVGKTPRGDAFARLVDLTREYLPGEVDRPTLEDSLRHLAGTYITQQLLFDTCWRIAGNTPRLRHRHPVPPWHIQRFAEWVPCHIVSCKPSRKYRHMGAEFTVRIMAGTPCPRVVYKWFSEKQCNYLAHNGFGFTRFGTEGNEPKYQYSSPEQLVNMRIYALIEPQLCGKEPGFDAARCPSSVQEWNREVLKRRFRVDPGYDCPKRFPLTLACHNCPVGLEKCPAACHRKAWYKKACPRCKADDAIFDRDTSTQYCVDCYRILVLKGEI